MFEAAAAAAAVLLYAQISSVSEQFHKLVWVYNCVTVCLCVHISERTFVGSFFRSSVCVHIYHTQFKPKKKIKMKYKNYSMEWKD